MFLKHQVVLTTNDRGEWFIPHYGGMIELSLIMVNDILNKWAPDFQGECELIILDPERFKAVAMVTVAGGPAV